MTFADVGPQPKAGHLGSLDPAFALILHQRFWLGTRQPQPITSNSIAHKKPYLTICFQEQSSLHCRIAWNSLDEGE